MLPWDMLSRFCLSKGLRKMSNDDNFLTLFGKVANRWPEIEWRYSSDYKAMNRWMPQLDNASVIVLRSYPKQDIPSWFWELVCPLSHLLRRLFSLTTYDKVEKSLLETVPYFLFIFSSYLKILTERVTIRLCDGTVQGHKNKALFET